MAKLTLEQKKERPNSSYWLDKADEAFMVQFRGLPCEFCKVQGYDNTEGTCFHHIVPKKQSKSLRYDRRNGIILCPGHHKWSGDMAIHSDSVYVIEKWTEFFIKHFKARYEWCKANTHLKYRYTYKDAYEGFKSGLKQFTEETV